jgi:hypothetical protein
MATILGKENLSKIGKIDPVSKGLAAGAEDMGFQTREGSGPIV